MSHSLEDITLGLGDTTTPWHPMKDPVDLKTNGKFLEELGELVKELGSLIQIAARCQIQGLEERNPKTGEMNALALENEIADVKANIRLMTENFGLDEERMSRREEKKYHYLKQLHAGA